MTNAEVCAADGKVIRIPDPDSLRARLEAIESRLSTLEEGLSYASSLVKVVAQRRIHLARQENSAGFQERLGDGTDVTTGLLQSNEVSDDLPPANPFYNEKPQ